MESRADRAMRYRDIALQLRHRTEHLRYPEARAELLSLSRRFERMADWLLGHSAAEGLESDPGTDPVALPGADPHRSS